MSKRNWLIAAALASAAIGGGALAQNDAPAAPALQHGGRGGGMLQADTNHDGNITRAEYQAWIDQRFAARDADHDGRIAPGERQRGGGGTGGRAVDQAGFRRAALARFDRLDTNHDGTVDAQEQTAARELMRFRMAGRGGEHRPGMGPGMGPGMAPGMGRGMGHGQGGGRAMLAADTNGDGRISRDEFLAAARTRFDRMDTNHDGYIDQGERPARGRHGMHGPDQAPPPAPPASGQ